MTTTNKTLDHLIGQTGRMYSARKGTVRMFVLSNGEVWRANTGNFSNIIFSDSTNNWWVPTAEECKGYSYFTMQMTRDDDDLDIYPKVGRG